jgi:hypothetical protein
MSIDADQFSAISEPFVASVDISMRPISPECSRVIRRWEPFLATVDVELQRLDAVIRKLSTRPLVRSPRRGIGTQGVFLGPIWPPIALPDDPSILHEIDNSVVFSNYLCFPRRSNASARIIKPHRLEYVQYRRCPPPLPVLRGMSIS